MNEVSSIGMQAPVARIRLRCLGSWRLDDEAGNERHLRTRKSRALLAFLALTPGRCSREQLADLLWSDRGPEQARSSLRQSLYELRHFDGSSAPLVSVGRDDVALNPDLVATDISLCIRAAEAGDCEQLAVLLAEGGQGLLTDLDGLDPEFDGWLRTLRAHEPGHTLGTALAAAERCLADEGPRAAQAIVAQVQRLDPTSEEAARLAMRIDSATGNRSALHRHFDTLRGRLRDELGAEPSSETTVLFHELANGGGPAQATAAQLGAPGAATAGPPAFARKHRAAALTALLALLGSAILIAGFGLFGRDRTAAAPAPPVVLAVLPFDQQPGDDGFLASGLREHTRLALSRNGSLRVLGRATTTAMVEQGISPNQYRRRFGVTHLLEGTVQRSGDEVRVAVSLSRTSDGVAVWNEMFRGRVGQPLSLQEAIANAIEGKIRGRLARDGGRRAEQIVTTPEVYGLYSAARQLVASRDPANSRRAGALLREAVAKDPNYAPAWSLLGAAIHFDGRVAIVDALARSEATAAVKRALALAPNLAQAHATLAILEGEHSAAAERPLRRAVALDPNYAEAWNWLGNALVYQHRTGEAIDAYRRAIAIDPLFHPPIQNLVRLAEENRNRPLGDETIRRAAAAGANEVLLASLQADRLYLRGDYSGAVKQLLDAGLKADGRTPPPLWMNWLEALSGLGRFDAMHPITGCPDWYAPLLRGELMPPRHFDGRAVLPEEFWTSIFFSAPASRAMLSRGRPRELVRMYRQGFKNADEFISLTGRHGTLNALAPIVAVALAETGSRSEARYLLSAASNQIEPALKRSGNRWLGAELAAIRAAQGERAQAIGLLDSAVRDGWLPDGRNQPLDLARHPAFASLTAEPRFRQLRGRILTHIARERSELGPAALPGRS